MSNNDNFIISDSADLTVPIVTEIDLEINFNGVLDIVAYVFPRAEDQGAECRVEFEEVIEKLINYYQTSDEQDSLTQIYSIAHELARQADRLRDIGRRLEESQEDYLPPLSEEDDVDGNIKDEVEEV